MTTFNYDRRDFYQREGESGVYTAPSLLSGGTAASYVPSFIATQVDRSIYGATEGGAGSWAFGSLRTPQRFFLDWKMGWDPDVATRPDPNWNEQQAGALWATLPPEQTAAVLYTGGEDLKKDIIENSVSSDHFQQRLSEIETITRAKVAIEKYDQESNFLTYGLHKAFSGGVNYVFSDPLTTISIVASAGLATPAAAGAAASGVATANTLSIGTRVAQFAATYNRTWRTATYLWDGLDGASSAYSSWDQLNSDGYRIYGKTYQADDNWTDDVAFGAVLGLAFAGASDFLGRGMKKADEAAPSVVTSMENMAARSAEGTLGTALDHVALSAWRSSKSRLERSLDTITGPNTELRRVLMDDEARRGALWGTREDMDQLSDWIETNKPNADELSQYVADRAIAAEQNRQLVESWQGEVEDYVLGGGDQRHFFRKKAADLLRKHMGDDFGQFRFVLDYLEDASGDSRIVAEWMARGDKDRVIRVANAINANKRVGILEDKAIKGALERVRLQGLQAAADETVQAANRIHDNIVQGRFQGAVDILNEMHEEAATRQGNLLAQVDGAINQLNDAFVRLNDEAFEKLDHYKEMMLALRKVKDAISSTRGRGEATRNRLARAMDPEADNAAVLNASREIVDDDPMMSTALSEAVDALRTASDNFKKAEETLSGTLDEVRRTRREVIAKAGKDALDRTMEESGTFPLWKVDLSAAGFDAVRRSAVRQTQAANRWKVEFVDYFLGENTADNMLNAGTNPLRPVLRERKPIQRMSVAEQERIINEEIAAVAPEIAAVRAGAADVSLDVKIANLRDTSAKMRKGLEDAKGMLERRVNKTDEGGKRLSEMIAKRERTLKRTDNLIKRLEGELQGQVDVLNKDISPSATITADTVRSARNAEKIAAHTKVAEKLKGVDPMTKKGRNLRDKVRTAAADMQGGTKFNSLTRESEMVADELRVAKGNMDQLIKNGATEADPAVKIHRDEVAYLEKRANKIKEEIDAINGRPAMIRRSHELQGANPPVTDIVEISRLRAEIASAVRNGEADLAEELNRRLYNKYGDATRLPRWRELEDFFTRRENDIIDGNPTEELMAVSVEGRNIKFSVMERPLGDVAAREGVEVPLSRLPSEAPAPISARSRGTRKAQRETEMLQEAVAGDAEAAAARNFNESARTIRYETSNVLESTPDTPTGTTATGSRPQPKKEGKLTAEEEKAAKEQKILDSLNPTENPGERLVITNDIIMRMGQIPMLRGLGRALFKLQTAGTGFGSIHGSSRALDMLVTAFNMLDRPEALVKSLGFNNGSSRTLQNFRDQGRIAVNELAVVEQRARRAGQYTGAVDEDRLLQDALDNGDPSTLNPGMRAMYDVMRRHYDESGRRLAVTSGEGTLRPNYRPREGNTPRIMARMQEAKNSFRDAYADRIMNSGQPLPDALADRIGVPRGTAFNVLSSADQAAFRNAVTEYANDMAGQTISRLTHGVTEAGVGYRRATTGADSRAARTLEDEVYRDPRVRQWYVQSPVQEHKVYMEIRSPQILFDAQLSEALGMSASFDDVIGALRLHVSRLPDPNIKSEFGTAIDRLERKWNYHTGRAQYVNNEFLDPAFRTSTGVVRGSFGSFWGLAGMVTEVPRAIAAAKMYGGSMQGIFDMLHAIRRSGDLSAVEDIAHATDQYVTHAHSSFGSSVGTSFTERLIAPWERVWHTMRGEEVLTNGGVGMSRFSSTVVAAAEAYGETGMRLGGMQYFSGIARVIADRQAKRFISRNLDNMERLATALQGIGAVAENTPASRAAFKNAAREAGIPYDVALQMNHAGLLTPDTVRALRNGLTGQDEVWNLGMLRGRVDDRTMGAALDFLTAAHNFHVPTSSLASSVEAGNVFGKLFYNLTNYSRAFALNVAFRTAANGRLATMLGTFAAVMIGENLYQTSREVATGKTSVEKLEEEWNDDPTAFFLKRAVKSPWLGAHNGMAHSAVEAITGGSSAAAMRGNNVLGPIIQSGNQLQKLIFSNEKTGERDFKFLETHTPIYNAWYSRMMLGTEE